MALSSLEVSVFLSLVNLMLSAIMAYSWLINKRLPGTGAWTTGVLCLSLGIVFFIISASCNYALIKIAGLFFRMGGACIIVYGCGVFIGRVLSKKISTALFALFSLFSVILLVNQELQAYLFIIDIFFIIIYIRGVVILVSARSSGIKGGFAVVYPLSFFALFHFYNFLRFFPLFGRNLREFSIGETASTYTVFLGALVMTQVLQGYFKFRNEIIASAEEKEMLLREMHHRTKNNLSLINNMVALDSMYVEDPDARDILEILRNKIKTVMLLHQQLQDVEVAESINAQEYLGLVVDSFSDSRIGGENIVQLEKNIEPIELEVSSAIPIGLILNELTTNCCKHAFEDRENGRINISLKRLDEVVEVAVSDNGKGLTKPPKEGSLGLSLVRNLTKQLNGEFSIGNNRKGTPGTLAVLTFPFRND